MDEEKVEEVVQTIVKGSSKLIPAAVGLLALGAGIGIGYILGRRTKYEVIKLGDRLPENRPPRVVIDEVELNERKPKMSIAQAKEILEEDPRVTVVTLNEQEVEVETANLFASQADEEDDWDYDEEIKRRNPLSPYIIHKDEFFGEEMATENYIQSTLTYYAGDNVLCDEDQKPIYNHQDVVGHLRFGHGSGDPNVVYIRNMSRECEYEVIRDPGLFSVEVEGLEIENNARVKDLKHSKERKFRPE